MQVLNKEEAASVEIKAINGGRRSKNGAVLDAVAQLQEGQSLIVKKDEWVGKTPPRTTIGGKAVRSQLGGRKYHCFTLKDESGWLIAPKKQA